MQLSAFGKGWRTHAYKVRFKKLIMQLSVLAILFTGVPAHAHVFSQTISLVGNNMPLEKVFVEIKKQTGYTFAYFESDLAKARPVNINVSNAKLTEVLAAIFENQPLTYTIVEKVIVVKTKSEKKIVVSGDALPALPIDVRGRVMNEDGEPVAGATVMVKGTKNATATTEEGEFILRNVDPTATIIVTGVNILTIEQEVRNQKNLLLQVKGKTGKLDEVQVIAYGTTSQRFATGNTATIKAADIEKQPINNPLLALQGRVPGVVVTQSNGLAGGGVTIRIQGRNNLITNFTSSDPLIVIDGVPYPSQNLRTFNGGTITTSGGTILGNSSGLAASEQGAQGSPLAYINPADIESIDILKDADATAIYGSRAANGAVLITTKRGKMGQTKIDINVQKGWGKVGHMVDLLNAQQYMQMRRETKFNDNAAVLPTDYDLRGFWDTTRYTDWQKELIGGTASYTRIITGISGGSGNMSYLINGTYGRETTVFPGNFANTSGSIHFNVNTTTTNQKFRLQLSGNYSVSKNSLPTEDFTSRAIGIIPVAPSLYGPDGNLNWAPDPSANGNSTWNNPLANSFTLFDAKTSNLVSNAIISYRLLPGLEIKSSFGYIKLNSDQFSSSLNGSLKPEQRPGRVRSAIFTFNNMETKIIEPQITYRKTTRFGKIDVLAGATIQQQDNTGRALTVQGQPSDQLLKDMAAGTSTSVTQTDISTYRYNAIFGRLTYNLQDELLINGTMRRDGSSRFGEKNLFHNFGAIGMGWIFTQEKIFKKYLPFLSFGKIRGSYGTTGNDQINNYQYLGLFGSFTSSVPYQGVAALQTTVLPNPHLEWEETRKLQIGFDIGILKDRVLATVNYVRNRSSNNLSTVPLPITTGFESITDNLDALIQNTAWEFSVNLDLLKERQLSWNSSFNITFPKNKLLAFPDISTSPYYQYVIGQSLSIVRDNTFYGINPLTGGVAISPVPDALFDAAPRFYGGFQNNIRYKGIEISFLLQFVKQEARSFVEGYTTPGRFSPTASTGNQPIEVLDRWQKPDVVSSFQKFTTNGSFSTYAGTRNFGDASFIRLKNISCNYVIPRSVVDKFHIQTCRVFVTAQNLLTFTRYNGFDPESLNNGSLPPLRMITTGIQVVF